MGRCWQIVLTEVAPSPCGELHPVTSLEAQIRQKAWNPLWRAIRKRWPAAEAWTVIEWAPKTTGVHLHAIVRHAPELTPTWANGVMERSCVSPGGRRYRVSIDPVTDLPLLLDDPVDQVHTRSEQNEDVDEENDREALEAREDLEESEHSGNRSDRYRFENLVIYLTKQLRDLRIQEGWPPYFHAVSSSRGWAPKTRASSHPTNRSTKRSTGVDGQRDEEAREQAVVVLPVIAA